MMEEGGGESFWRNENRRENTVEYVRGRSSRQHSERWWNIWGDASALCRNEDTSPEKAILLHIKKQLQEPSIFLNFVFFDLIQKMLQSLSISHKMFSKMHYCLKKSWLKVEVDMTCIGASRIFFRDWD